MNINFLKENSKLLMEEINVANTDEIINAVIEQKFYSSLAYQIAEVSPVNSMEGGTFALTYVDDPLFPGKKKIQLLRNNIIINEDPIEDTGFTVEAIQDLQRQYGKSAIEYIGKVFGGISARNENIKLIQDLSATATSVPNLQSDPNNAEYSAYNIQQKVSEVLLLINSKSFKSLDGFCILPQKWAASILGVKNLLPEQTKEMGLYLGRNSRTKFFLNPDPLSIECFVGVHSEIPGLSSLIMSPYFHTIRTAINPKTGEEHVFNFNKYAITENALSLSDPSEKMLYKFEVDAVPMAGGGGAVAVLDENGMVNAAACQLNFIGVDVIAKQSPVNPCGVDIYIPTPNYPSHYNTNDGTTNGFVTSTPTSDRHVANPGTYDIGLWAAGSVHPTTRTNNLIFNNSADILFETEDSDITVNVFGADDSTVIATVSLIDVNGNTSTTNDNITLQITNYGVVSDKWKARIKVTIDIDAILPNSGKFSYEIVHQQASGDWKKEQHNLFYDSEPNTAVLTGVTIDESAGRITRYLSGVQYYNLNSPFTVDIADIDSLNGDSYPTIQTEIRGPEYGLPDLNLQGSSLTGWTNNWDDDNDTYNNSNWRITAHNYRFIGDDANILARTEDWVQGSNVLSPNKNILIDTWNSQSSELEEYFTDEDFRLMSDYSTAWDSTQSLVTYDGNNTGLQIIGGVIKIPSALSSTNDNNADFSNHQPLTNPDYSSSSGKEYYRYFTDVTNSVRGSAWLAIQGFTLQDLKDSKIELWFFVDGKFTSECYVHTTSEYEFTTMNGDNDPIRVNDSTTNNIHISFGSYGLDNTHNKFRIRLVINDTTIEPSSIVVSW